MNRPFLHVFRGAFVVTFLGAFLSCSNQGEGERCERDNGDDDCQEGLVCTPSTKLGGSADICCPPGESDVAECQPNNGGTTSASSSDASSSSTGGGGDGTSSSSSTGGGGAGGGSSSSSSSSASSSSSSSSSSSASSSSTGM